MSWEASSYCYCYYHHHYYYRVDNNSIIMIITTNVNVFGTNILCTEPCGCQNLLPAQGY